MAALMSVGDIITFRTFAISICKSIPSIDRVDFRESRVKWGLIEEIHCKTETSHAEFEQVLLVIALKQAFFTSVSFTSISRISVHSFDPSVADKFTYTFANWGGTVILLGNTSLTSFISPTCAIFKELKIIIL
jgi:hypothetical protein